MSALLSSKAVFARSVNNVLAAGLRGASTAEIQDARAHHKTVVGGSGGNRGDVESERMISLDKDGNYKLNFMVGVGGKKLPVLPKGTKVGSLVMGEFGLYYPPAKAHQDFLLSVQDIDVYKQGKMDSWYWPIVQITVLLSIFISLDTMSCLWLGKNALGNCEKKK